MVGFAIQPPEAEFFPVATYSSAASSSPLCTPYSVPQLAQGTIVYWYKSTNTHPDITNRAQQHLVPPSEWMHNTPLAVQETLAMTYKFSNLLGLIIPGAHKENSFGV